MIGQVIDGTYRVERELGEGGFGIVYLAIEMPPLERPVAIKLLRPAMVGEREIKRFMAEANSLAKLNHPNVVHIYRFGYNEGVPYIAMEFLKGRTLRHLIEHERPGVVRVLEIMRQVGPAPRSARRADYI